MWQIIVIAFALVLGLIAFRSVAAYGIVGTVSVGAVPYRLAFNPQTDHVFVANNEANTVSVLTDNPSGTPSVLATISVGIGPFRPAVNPQTNHVFVPNQVSNDVSVLADSSSGVTVIGQRISVGDTPMAIAVNRRTNHVFVANYSDGTVSVLDDSSSGPISVVATIPVGGGPYQVAVNPQTDRVFIANSLDNTVTVLTDTATPSNISVLTTIPVGGSPEGVAIDLQTSHVFVANTYDNTVSVLTDSPGGVTSLGQVIGVGAYPTGVAVNPATEHVFVTNYYGNSVSILTDSVNASPAALTTVAVPGNPFGLDVNPATGHVFVTQNGADSVAVLLDTPNPTTTVADPATVSAGAASATLAATVDAGANGPVDRGSVTFRVTNASNQPIGNAAIVAVKNSSAKGTFEIPIGIAAGRYTITAAYHDRSGLYADSQGTATLTIVATGTTTTVAPATTGYSSSDTNVSLSATVSSSAGAVNEGTVTFSVMQGTTVIGTPTTAGAVAAGQASVSYTIPGGTPAGSYTISGTYNPGPDFSGSSGTATLTITKAEPVVAWNPSSTTFTYGSRLGSGQLNASANVPGSFSYHYRGTTAAGQTVAGNAQTGTVLDAGSSTLTATFTPRDTTDYTTASKTAQLTATKAPLSVKANDATRPYGQPNPTFSGTLTGVVNGDTITASYTTPATASSPTGTYPITPALNDPDQRLSNYAVTSTNGKLTITAISTDTSANDATALVGAASVTLSATVTSAAGPVNEGSVTFSVSDGQGQPLGDRVSGAISNGQASASFAIPAGTPTGVYTVSARYHDPTGSFLDSAGTSTLTITYGVTVLGGQPIVVHYGYWALVQLQVVDGNGQNLSNRMLKVTAENLAPAGQPWNGQSGNFAHAFQFGQIGSGGGYRLAINSRPLSLGDDTLSYTVAGDPVIHTLTIRVVP